MLLMVEKGIRGGICHAIHRYAKANNKFIKNHDKNIESLYFKIKTGHSLGLLTPETIKVLENTENRITKDKNCENVPHPEITEVVLVHCNIVDNDYQQDSRVLYTFVLNKPFGSLLEISPKNHIKTLEYGLQINRVSY